MKQNDSKTQTGGSVRASEETTKAKDSWLQEHYEGQLAVDVFQDDQNNIVIMSTVAGVNKEDLDISINNDMVTIRGRRAPLHRVADDQYFYQECYWGGFSRSIILPVDVKADQAKASLKNGVLTITLPKADGVQVKILNIDQQDEE